MHAIDKLLASYRGGCEIGSVRKTSELRRVASLPQRDISALPDAVISRVTEELRTPRGEQRLRPMQAAALLEIAELGGGVVIAPVGSGKTLVSFLSPVVCGAENALLLVPAKLREKTRREFKQLRKHWQAPKQLTVQSYEMLSRHRNMLDEMLPDMIILDECHRAKNRKAAVTRRLLRYLREHQQTRVVAMSGTITQKSLSDWWHLALAALPSQLIPMPRSWREMTDWDEALGARTMTRDASGKIVPVRRGLGALATFGDTVGEVREALGRITRGTPGIVAADTDDVPSTLYVEPVRVRLSAIDEALKELNETWELPDGTPVADPLDYARRAMELSHGFYYRYASEAPKKWLAARREAHAFFRERLRYSRKLDTPGDVMKEYADHPVVRAWLAVRDKHKPVTSARWFSGAFLERVLGHVSKECLLWVGPIAVGKKLQKLSGFPYYSQDACDASGKHIYDHGDGPAIVSIAACSDGLNLQRFSESHVLFPPSTGAKWEQLLGRTHRYGQEADEVIAYVYLASQAAEKAFRTAMDDAIYMQQVTGQKTKLASVAVLTAQ